MQEREKQRRLRTTNVEFDDAVQRMLIYASQEFKREREPCVGIGDRIVDMAVSAAECQTTRILCLDLWLPCIVALPPCCDIGQSGFTSDLLGMVLSATPEFERLLMRRRVPDTMTSGPFGFRRSHWSLLDGWPLLDV